MTKIAPLGDGSKVDSSIIGGTPQAAAKPTPTKRVRRGGQRAWYTSRSAPKFQWLRNPEITDKNNKLGDVRALSDEELEAEVFFNGVPLPELLNMAAGSYQLTSPYAVLAKALCVAALDEPDTNISLGMDRGMMPLNLMQAIVGISAQGKGSAMRTPLKCASDECEPDTESAASGEALIEMFYEKVMVDQPDGKGAKPEWVRREGRGVFCVWDEIDDFSAKSGIGAQKGTQRVTSSMSSRMRTLFIGGKVGDKAVNRSERPAYLEGYSYRFCSIIQGTPDRMGVLLHDDKGGLLQRTLIFLAKREEEVPEDMDELFEMWMKRKEDFCKRLGVPLQEGCPSLSVWGPPSVELTDEVKELFSKGRLAHTYGRRDEIEGHLDSIIVRMAAIFAGWRAGYNQHAVVDVEAWWWAMCVAEKSRRALEVVKGQTQDARKVDLREQGEDAAFRKQAEEDAKERHILTEIFPKVLDRVADLIDDIPRRDWLNSKPRRLGTCASANDLKKSMSGNQAKLVDAALEQHINEGVVEEFLDGSVTRYRTHPNAADRYAG